jgi:PAS domain S-box-containing protein
MIWQFTTYTFLTLASAVVSSVLALTAWYRRPAPGATPFCLLMLAMAVWALGFALELASPNLSSAIVWDGIAVLGAISAPTLWLIFTLHYGGRVRWLERQSLILLTIEPLLTLLLVGTNVFHSLAGNTAQLNSRGPFSSLFVISGWWYWVNFAYSLLLLALGAFALCSFILTFARMTHLYCIQGGCLFIAVLMPWLGNVLTIPGLNSTPHLASFAFLTSCLLFVLDLFLFRVLDIVPVAREIAIQNMREAAIALDAHDRVVYLNSAARRLINFKSSKAIGHPFGDIFATWPELLERCHNLVELDEEISMGEGDAIRYFGLRISPLYRHSGHLAVTGRLIVLHDLTERIQAERALKESEGRFRNIFAEVPIGMAVVDSDGHLLQVNRAFCEMLGYNEQELIGRSISAITHPTDAGKDTLLAEQALTGEITSYQVEKRYLKKNHETLWCNLTATILRNQGGVLVYSLVMLENIIERKRAKLLEEERHHVAYELHDGLAQVAVSTHQHLQAFANHYHPRSPQAKLELNRALDLAQRSVREARRLIAGLRPTALDDFGLATALRLQVEAQRADGWTIIFEESLGPERLPPAIETTLYSIAQESLTNVRKHAQSLRVRLTLERRDAKIRLEVQDWGCGFETDILLREFFPGEHVGIRAMQERVELVGGHFLVSSQPGVGTLLVAEVPATTSDEAKTDAVLLSLLFDERSIEYEQ